MKNIVRFFKDEEGVTAIEYGLLAALIALALVVGAAALGTNLGNFFQAIADYIGGVPIPAPVGG
jgi:pilus assembly protein Flp/PilA